MAILLLLLDKILSLYVWVVILWVAASWFIAFRIINPYNPAWSFVLQTLSSLVEPPLNFIRQALPPLGGLDLSPMVLLGGIWLVRGLIGSILWEVGITRGGSWLF